MPVVSGLTPGPFEAAFDVAEKTFGGVDVLLNNAGYGGDTTTFVEASEQNWDRVMEVNLKGAWSVSQIAAQRMLAAKTSGNIINITSIAFATIVDVY